jgi:hypothetical protein
MEEENKKIGTEQNSSLPIIDIQYNEPDTTESQTEPSERIPNSLLQALSNRAKGSIKEIEDKYGIKITEAEFKEVVDDEGNPKKLTKRQDRILLAFNSELSKHIEEVGIKELVEKTESGEKVKGSDSIASFFVNLEELCRKVEGKEEKWKKKKQQAIEEELQKISQIKQIQIYKVREKVGTDSKGKDVYENVTYKAVDPYIYLTGASRQKEMTGGRTTKAVEVVFSRVFLERIKTRSTPILDSYWELKDSNGGKIYTAIFTDLSKLVFRLRWSHIYHELPKIEKYIKKEGILDTEKISSLRKQALTHAPISVEEIKSITNADYTNRKRRRDFWKELWEALRALIVYGIITTDTRIDQDKGEVILVYNPDFDTPKQISLPISGGYWEENPFKQ